MEIFLIIILGTLSRLIPHWPNFTPIGGLALFSGAKINGKMAFFLPLLIMFFSDLFLGLHPAIPFVYGSFVISTLLGRQLQTNRKVGRLLKYSLLSSCLFFLTTNFGVWLTTSMYRKNIFGLVDTYVAGLPFFRNTVLGDLFYTTVFFFGYSFISVLIRKLRFNFRHLKI